MYLGARGFRGEGRLRRRPRGLPWEAGVRPRRRLRGARADRRPCPHREFSSHAARVCPSCPCARHDDRYRRSPRDRQRLRGARDRVPARRGCTDAARYLDDAPVLCPGNTSRCGRRRAHGRRPRPVPGAGGGHRACRGDECPRRSHRGTRPPGEDGPL